ncbi:DUF397 domain-containing protein [Nocardia sp. CA-120079]|uniref:DUF397 domain-containing protein n=1 Tax=Nocardia sp. CA-120079 TaxID=3239974 RepID=UPI003D9542F9
MIQEQLQPGQLGMRGSRLADQRRRRSRLHELTGPALVFASAEWDAFIAGVQDGEFTRRRSGSPMRPRATASV